MQPEQLVRIAAGSLVLTSLALGIEANPIFTSKCFLFLAAFVGLNLRPSGFTKICPLDNVLAKFGIKNGSC